MCDMAFILNNTSSRSTAHLADREHERALSSQLSAHTAWPLLMEHPDGGFEMEPARDLCARHARHTENRKERKKERQKESWKDVASEKDFFFFTETHTRAVRF